MAPKNISLLYVTVPAREEGLTLARHLLELRLIACANLLGQATASL